MAKRIPLVFEGGEIIESKSTDTMDLNNGVVKATGGNTERKLADNLGDMLSVKDFGAKGDGTTDDTAAFQAAAAHGGVIYVPHGTYKLTEPVQGEFISFGHPTFTGAGATVMDKNCTDLYNDYVHKNVEYLPSGTYEQIYGDKQAMGKWNFKGQTIFDGNETHNAAEIHEGNETHGKASGTTLTYHGTEVHDGAETHSGAETHNGSGTYNAFQTFNSGANIKGGLTASGGATIAGGLVVSGAETHNGAGTYNAMQTFNSGTNIKGGATISGGMTVTSGNINGTCTSAVSAGTADTAGSASNAGHATSADSATSAGTAGSCAGNAATATKVGHDLIMKINGGNTEGTNKYTYNGSAGKTLNFSAGSNISLTASEGAVVIAATAATSVNSATSAGSADSASSAGVANKLGTATVGGEKQPIYLSSGSPVEFTSTIGNATTPVYLSGGIFKACDAYPSGNSGSASTVATALSLDAVVTSSWDALDGSSHAFYYPSTGKWLTFYTKGGGAAGASSGTFKYGQHAGCTIVNVSDTSSGYFATTDEGGTESSGSGGSWTLIAAIKLAG